jgi:hypothetical protein
MPLQRRLVFSHAFLGQRHVTRKMRHALASRAWRRIGAAFSAMQCSACATKFIYHANVDIKFWE